MKDRETFDQVKANLKDQLHRLDLHNKQPEYIKAMGTVLLAAAARELQGLGFEFTDEYAQELMHMIAEYFDRYLINPKLN